MKKRIFSPKVKILYKLLRKKWKFRCKKCGLEETILVKEFEDNWECPYCDHIHYMPDYIGDSFKRKQNLYLYFKKSGLFARDNNQEGAIPVILSLITFKRIFHDTNFLYSTSLNLEKMIKCEIDFCVIKYKYNGEIQMGIGECKSDQQNIEIKDIENLKYIQDEIKKIGIVCYLIFSKTSDNYEKEELTLFKALKEEGRDFIILSNNELEPYHPYWEEPKAESIPEKYAQDMEGMCVNSLFLYLTE